MSTEDDPKTGAPRRTDEYTDREPEKEQDKTPSGQGDGSGEHVNQGGAASSEVADSDAPAHREPGTKG